MPIYRYRCPECGLEQDGFNKIDERNTNAPECHGQMELKIMPTMLNMDMAPWDYYESPASGKPITSYKDRKKDMAESGCVDYEPSVAKYAERDKRKAELEMDRKIEQTVTKEIQAMSCDKREKLGNELASGADCVPERYTYGE